MIWNRIFQKEIWTFISFYLEYLIVGFSLTSTVLSSDSFMLYTIRIMRNTTNNNPSGFFQPTGNTVFYIMFIFSSCFPVCGRENCAWSIITEEVNWKTHYIISSQIFKPVVNNSHHVGQKGLVTNCSFWWNHKPKVPHDNLAATFPTIFIRKTKTKLWRD